MARKQKDKKHFIKIGREKRDTTTNNTEIKKLIGEF
jgi:hypothetical protein